MTKLEHIVKLSRQGLSIDAIVARTGCKRGTVLVYRSMAGVSKTYKPQGIVPQTIHLPLDTAFGLEPYAKARGLTIGNLVRKLMAACVEDNMVDAVLDDGITTRNKEII